MGTTTTAPEYLTTLRDGLAGAVQQWVDQSTTAWDQWARAWAPDVGRAPQSSADCGCHERAHSHEHVHVHAQQAGCGCGDPCACCVPEADVVLHARVGEMRVVPFRLHNAWRREREVTIAVGPWHTCDGDDLVVRAQLEEEKLVLAPCEDRIVRLLVTARASSGQDRGAEDGDAVDSQRSDGGRIGDLESCASAYADVRFEGCARPQRVAVVVSPSTCDPVDVGCDCGCCC